MATEGCSTGHTGGSGFVQPYGLSYAIKDDEGRRREVEEFKEVLADQLVYKVIIWLWLVSVFYHNKMVLFWYYRIDSKSQAFLYLHRLANVI